MIPDHLITVVDRILKASILSPPPPWRRIAGLGMGGITEVGFVEDGELLLVLSHQGRGVIDCSNGKNMARNPDEDRRNWYGRNSLIAKGIGPFEGAEIRLMGLWGGGLPTMTPDGWQVQRFTLAWPADLLLLLQPECDIYRGDTRFTKLFADSEVRAFGFSYTGKTLIIATSSDLLIFGRDKTPENQI